MSLKQEIQTWVVALGHYDSNEFEESLKKFDEISDTSKILFNCGIIYATLGEHDKAVECYQRAVRLDQYLAVAYFQQGVSNFLVGDFEEALANFNDTLLYLRGNTYIDYEQLGLKFKLFSCEVLFNRGLCYIYLQQTQAGLGDLTYAAKEKVTADHEVIEEAIREEAQGYTVFSIPVGVIYRPNSAKVKNLKSKDYLGRARLIAAADRGNLSIGFAGAELKKPIEVPQDDRPTENISYAASNLHRPEIQSRTRQQSEPPINRNLFPPTPPPDSDQQRPTVATQKTAPTIATARANSVRNVSTRKAAEGPTSPRSIQGKERPRLGTNRTASEPRGPSSRSANSKSQRDIRETGDVPEKPARLFRETTPARRDDNLPVQDEGAADGDVDDEYPGELYDLYRNTAHSNPYTSAQKRGSSRTRHRSKSRTRNDYVDEDEENNSLSAHSSLEDFEILNNAGGTLSRPLRNESRVRTTSRREAVQTVRVKVHNGDDTRYVMVNSTIMYEEFLDRVRDKFQMEKRFKIKIKDEGDMITMGDRDDWEMAVQTVRREARKEQAEMGKMEIWTSEVPA